MNRLNYATGVAKLDGRHRLLFQRLFFGALIGCLLSLVYNDSPLLETLELDMMEWRYKVQERLANLPGVVRGNNRAVSSIVIVAFDDKTQFDVGRARFNEDPAQRKLAEVINKIEEGKPALVVLDLDLRGAANAELIETMRRNKNIVLSLFDSLEGSSELPSAEFTNRAAGLGYHDLIKEPGGKVLRLPIRTEEESEPSVMQPIQSLTRAVLRAYGMVTGVNYESRLNVLLPDQAGFIDYHDVNYQEISMRKLWRAGFDSSIFEDKIVLIGSTMTQKRDVFRPKTPFRKAPPDVVIHADALATVINGEVITSFPRSYAKHFLLIVGALAGAIASALPMGRRIAAMFGSAAMLVVLAQFSFQVLHVALPVVSPLAMIASGFILGTVIYLDTDLRQRNRELAAAREMMQVRAEEERKRIAEDLHDETLPALSSIARMADDLSVEFQDSGSPRKMREKLDAAIAEMRRVINDLHPSALETMGFVSALENLALMLERETDMRAEFDWDGKLDEGEVSNFAKLQIYRIVQEALNNVRKHSGAEQVHVIIRRKNDDLQITVIDNGRGIDPTKIRPDSHGLLNIRHRAALVGASVEWRKPRKFSSGTEFIVTVPLMVEAEILKGLERKYDHSDSR